VASPDDIRRFVAAASMLALAVDELLASGTPGRLPVLTTVSAGAFERLERYHREYVEAARAAGVPEVPRGE
jgi:hypothetical protein